MAPYTRNDLYIVWKKNCGVGRGHSGANSAVLDFVLKNSPSISVKSCRLVEQRVSLFCSKLLVKLRKWNKNHTRFAIKKNFWLNEKFSLPQMKNARNSNSQNKGGRPLKPFQSCTRTVQLRKVTRLSKHTPEELTGALKKSLADSGNKEAAKLVNIMGREPDNAKKILNTWENSTPGEQWSPDKALSMLFGLELTEAKYKRLRAESKGLAPPYETVVEARNRAITPVECMTITETSAEVELQALLDHTASRILETLDGPSIPQHSELTLISK